MLPPVRPWSPVLIATALLLSGAACSANSDTPDPVTPNAATPAPDRTSVSPTSGPASAKTTPAPAPTKTADKARPKRRTTKELRGALLALKDLPPGFEVDSGTGPDDNSTLSSSKASCQPLLDLMNQKKLPSSTATADASFSGGQEGPFVDESIDALGTKRAARAFISRYRDSVTSCRSVQVRVPGEGSSALRTSRISFGKLGDDAFAARFSARGGPLDGFEIILVGVASGDVVIGLSTTGLDGADTEMATEDAVKKVERKLGSGRTI